MTPETTCPACGSTSTVPIVYGMPGPHAKQRADRGQIALGGCVVEDDAPAWTCRDCNHSWGRRNGTAADPA